MNRRAALSPQGMPVPAGGPSRAHAVLTRTILEPLRRPLLPQEPIRNAGEDPRLSSLQSLDDLAREQVLDVLREGDADEAPAPL
jgi:hypothetical protein